jgi:hypothetical protein
VPVLEPSTKVCVASLRTIPPEVTLTDPMAAQEAVLIPVATTTVVAVIAVARAKKRRAFMDDPIGYSD